MKKRLLIAIIISIAGLQGQAQQASIKNVSGSYYVMIDNTRLPQKCIKTATEVADIIDPATGIVRVHRQDSELNLRVSPRYIIAPHDIQSATGGRQAVEFDQLAQACKAYGGQNGTEAGKWRVPTQRELELILILTPKIYALGSYYCDQFDTKYYYWSSTEWTTERAWYVNFKNYTSNARTKIINETDLLGKEIAMYGRCIRDVTE